MTGAFDKIDIRGANGQRLKEKWQGSPTTYLGVMVNGFPNMLWWPVRKACQARPIIRVPLRCA